MTETPSVVTVATSGTPVQAFPSGPQACKASIENPAGTTGNAYLGIAGMNKTTLVGVITVIQPGQVRALEDQGGNNTIDTTQYYVDHDTSGSKLLAVYSRR